MIRLLALSLLTLPALAQQPPTPPAHDTHNRRVEIRMPGFDHDSGTMGIVPPGTWWRNPETIKALNLSPDQQKKMDDTFRQNRIALIDVKANLEKEQLNLEPLVNANPPDTNKALAQISKIADLRADLEKANARMLLGLRAQLTADQWTKLQSVHPAPFTINMPEMRNMRDFHTKTGNSRTETTTCTESSGNVGGKKQCTTSTITWKDEGGKPVITTCVTAPGQTTPRCSTSQLGPVILNLNQPPLELPPAALNLPQPAPFGDFTN